MIGRTDIADISIGLFSLLAGGAIALIGAVILWFGVSGFVVGVHGGPITAGVMSLFGAALLFIGYYGGRYGLRLIRHRNNTEANSP
jgi:hypothetical protein